MEGSAYRPGFPQTPPPSFHYHGAAPQTYHKNKPSQSGEIKSDNSEVTYQSTYSPELSKPCDGQGKADLTLPYPTDKSLQLPQEMIIFPHHQENGFRDDVFSQNFNVWQNVKEESETDASHLPCAYSQSNASDVSSSDQVAFEQNNTTMFQQIAAFEPRATLPHGFGDPTDNHMAENHNQGYSPQQPGESYSVDPSQEAKLVKTVQVCSQYFSFCKCLIIS